MPTTAQHAEQLVTEEHKHPFLTLLIRGGFVLSVVLTAIIAVVYVIGFVAGYDGLDDRTRVHAFIYLAMLAVAAIGCISMLVLDIQTEMNKVRIVARITMVALLAGLVLNMMTAGLSWVDAIYVFQFIVLIAYQVSIDPSLARPQTFHSPWKVDEAAERRGYITLNFFNLFWVFTIASIAGLVVEILYHAAVFGGYQDRAGLLWGPFSPIYGVGAVLMTIALNRFWDRSKIVIFLVSGLIGAAFEFFVSYFMESAFGIVAWDYTGTFLNIDGRTNFWFFCMWGILGLVWIKLLLPDVLRIVDAIPLRWRSTITIICASLMLVDAVMTIMALDLWYQRLAGTEPSNDVALFFDQNFNNDFMAERFQSMSIDPDSASRL